MNAAEVAMGRRNYKKDFTNYQLGQLQRTLSFFLLVAILTLGGLLLFKKTKPFDNTYFNKNMSFYAGKVENKVRFISKKVSSFKKTSYKKMRAMHLASKKYIQNR